MSKFRPSPKRVPKAKPTDIGFKGKYGRFTLSVQFISRFPKQAQDIMGQGIILDAQISHDDNEIKYLMLCEKFDMCEGNHIPMYKWGLAKENSLSGKEEVVLKPKRTVEV